MSTKRERDEARRRVEQEQEHRKSIEAPLAELEKQPGGASEAQLRALGLVELPLPPATEFIRKRLNEASPDDPQFNSKWKQAIVDLVASDVPLDRHTRSKIAGELRRLYFSDGKRDRHAKRQTELAAIEDYMRYLISCGMTMKEAEHPVVEEMGQALGIATVAALRKRRQRARDL
jgi:hypothetical protein